MVTHIIYLLILLFVLCVCVILSAEITKKKYYLCVLSIMDFVILFEILIIQKKKTDPIRISIDLYLDLISRLDNI